MSFLHRVWSVTSSRVVRRQSHFNRLASSTPTSSQPDAPESKAKSKPKENTSLRRAAAASLPIRKNPTPTRSSIQSVLTLATAKRYNLVHLQRHFRESGRMYQDALWIPQWGSRDSGEVFVFGNGCFVCWGMSERESDKFASAISAQPSAAVSPLKEYELEELEFVTDPNEKTRLQGDLILLGQTPSVDDPTLLPSASHLAQSVFPVESFPARYAFSQALARSTALSVIEESLDDYLSSVDQLPDTLARRGKPGLKPKELTMKLGELMQFRQGINLNPGNFVDIPDFYWAEPALEKYFLSLSDALDMKARMNAVNAKITYAAELQGVIRELLTSSSAHRMELIIIALIAVEVVIALIRDGPELWYMYLAGSNRKSEPQHEAQN